MKFNRKMFRLTLKIVLLCSAGFLLMHCGGGKTLSTADMENMSPQERLMTLEKQAEKKPNNIALKKQLYREYIKADMTPRALIVMEEILVLDPNDTEVLFEYGELQYRQGEAQKAYLSFLKVMQSPQAESYRGPVAGYIAGGYQVTQITNGPSSEGFPSFSADGSKLVYQKKSGDNWDIYEVNLSSRAEKALLSSAADEELPAYSPDGSQIVFTSNLDDRRPISSNYKVREISLVNLNNNYVITLTQSVADDWLPRYSHDGNQLLFVSERDDLKDVSYVEKQSDLYLMEKDGDFQRQLTNTPANEGGPCFSADDKRIYFHSDQNGHYDIFTMKNDGSQMMTIIDNQKSNEVNPHVSADGEWMVFMSDRDGNFELYRSHINGNDQERLTFSPGVDGNPAFSPDGRYIAFHSDRAGNFDIYLLDLLQKTGTLSSAELVNHLLNLTGGN